MKKTGAFIAVLLLVLGVGSMIWLYQKQIDSRITDTEGYHEGVTSVVKVNDPVKFVSIAKLSYDTDSNFRLMMNEMTSVIEGYQLSDAKSILFFFKGNKLETINAMDVYPEEQKSLLKSSESGSMFNGKFFVKLNEERFLLTKRKELLSKAEELKLDIIINPESTFGIQFLPENIVVDYSLEQTGLNQYVKGASFKSLAENKLNKTLLRFIPKGKEFGLFQSSAMTFDDSLWSNWSEGGFAMVRMDQGLVAFSSYSGSHHWQDLVGQWRNHQDSTSNYSLEGSPFEKVQISSGDENLDKMIWAGPFEDFILFAENKEALKSYLVLARAGLMRQETEFKWLPKNFTFAGDVSFASRYPYFFEEEKMNGMYAQIGSDFAFSRLQLSESLLQETFQDEAGFEVQLNRPQDTWFVQSHLLKGGLLLAQSGNQLLAFDRAGEKQWEQKLQGSIIGDISVIDLFGNGKKQYLFNTEKQIYLIDVKGRNVTGFPKNIIGSASAPVVAMDYDKNHNYRFLVGTKIGSVLNFAENGAIVNGWKHAKQETEIGAIYPHFVINSKDYVMIKNSNGVVNLVGRDGANRNFSNVSLSASENQFFKPGSSSSNSRFYSSNSSSQIEIVSLNGAKDSIQLAQEGIKIIDVFANQEKNFFVGIKGSRFILINSVGVIEHEIELIDATVSNYDIVFQKNGEIENIVISDDKNLYLYSRNGLLEEGYPIKCDKFYGVIDNNTNDAKMIFYDGEKLHLK